MQKASHEGVGFLSAGGDLRKLRDARLAEQLKFDEIEFARPQEERSAQPFPLADVNARFPSPPYLQWLYGYDALAEAHKYLTGFI